MFSASRLSFTAVVIFQSSISSLAFAVEIDFNRDIKPILSNNCYFCHGPDENERQGGTSGLRLDTRDGALADQGGHAAIVPGDMAKSLLLERVTTTDHDLLMPPRETGKKLTTREIELLQAWIAQGAPYAQHWSYGAPVRAQPPAVKNETAVKNEIDRFILSRLEKEGLPPSPEADRTTLIRRLFLDLTGLPPTIAEVDRFVADDRPNAYELLVDDLLNRETYGEHWARMWLDLARYADSAGYADDPPRTIWLFRDYVIRALNENKPFDQFTIEQLAGDLLPNPTEDQLIATAFHRNTLTNNEGGTNDEEFRNAAIVDRVNTTWAVWMGTTMACAQCHTHKFDPITQEEYFRVFAIFNNTEDADRRDEFPVHSMFTSDQQEQRAAWQARLDVVEKTLKTRTPEIIAAQQQWEAAFPLDLSWQALRPIHVESEAKSATSISEGIVSVAEGAKQDRYTVDLPVEGQQLRALQLEALTSPELPDNGPGHAGGNFVLTEVTATLIPPTNQSLSARYVRIEMPGTQKILSLAEVQVFQGGQNIAQQGEASQSSTDYDGPAKRAIDGNTDGRYEEAKSTTHTAISDNPWWELDLRSLQPIDRIVVWNRTDAGVIDRLKQFHVSILDDQRKVICQQEVVAVPNPSVELPLTGPRPLEFSQALADHSQSGFEAASILQKTTAKNRGWAVGGQIGQPHRLVLFTTLPFDAPAGSHLKIALSQQSEHANHTLGKFRLSVTSDERAKTWAATPTPVIEALAIATDKRSAEQQSLIDNFYLSTAPQLEPTRQQAARLKKQIADQQPATVPIFRELTAEKRRITRLQHRGNFMDLGQEVSPGTPAIFPPITTSQNQQIDRLALAKWLVNEDNPLTPRVIANRYWEKLFGTGLVATSEEFGSQGEQPSHPELLDWLATELLRLKWDTKAFVKTLVMSSTYRQSSVVDPAILEKDPDNRLLARGPRFRLTAETIRDQALAVSGLLSPKMYGPPVKPPQPAIGLNAAFGGGIDWKTSDGEDRYRRGLYTTWRRSNPYPSMVAFDAPTRETCTLRRSRSNTPLQALVTLNDPVYVEAAQALARRMMTEGGTTTSDRTTFGFRACLARSPTPMETERLLALYEAALGHFRDQPAEAKLLATEPLGMPAEGTDLAELATWTTVANVLLNLDETLMRR